MLRAHGAPAAKAASVAPKAHARRAEVLSEGGRAHCVIPSRQEGEATGLKLKHLKTVSQNHGVLFSESIFFVTGFIVCPVWNPSVVPPRFRGEDADVDENVEKKEGKKKEEKGEKKPEASRKKPAAATKTVKTTKDRDEDDKDPNPGDSEEAEDAEAKKIPAAASRERGGFDFFQFWFLFSIWWFRKMFVSFTLKQLALTNWVGEKRRAATKSKPRQKKKKAHWLA